MKAARSAGTALALSLLTLLPTSSLAQASPRIDASWYLVGPVEPVSAQPRQFSLKPNEGSDAPVLASSWLLPNVLVVSDSVAADADGKTLVAQGAQLFQQSNTVLPTFCPVTPLARPNANLCLVDSDLDGKLDSSVMAKLLLSFPRKLTSESLPLGKLATPVAIHAVAREQCDCKYRMDLIYIGRRKMLSMRDATFMTYIWFPGHERPANTYRGDNIEFNLEKLPPEADILGVKFINIHAQEKNMAFDQISGFASRPYDVPNTPLKTEWGF